MYLNVYVNCREPDLSVMQAQIMLSAVINPCGHGVTYSSRESKILQKFYSDGKFSN
jgi:hypothetical protein